MSRINGEKARASIAHKKRTIRRMKEREMRAQIAARNSEKGVVDKVKESKPVAVATDTLKKAGEALAELAEMTKPKRTRKTTE